MLASDTTELNLIERLKNDDKLAFSILFTRYYSDLVHFASGITRDKNASEEIVQDIFIHLWENRSIIIIHLSFKSYLLKSVQNRSIDWLRHENIKNSYAGKILNHPYLLQNDTENYLLYSELESKIINALDHIPQPYADVFKKSRFEALNHQQIADNLGISVRTVEDRISKTIKLLRVQLRDFLTLF